MSDQPPPESRDPRPISARVPERVSRGVMSNGFLAYLGPNELLVDFLQLLGRPPQLVSRVIMPIPIAEQFIAVLRENLSRYAAQHGNPPPLPKNPNDKPRTAQEVYDDLKIPDDMLSGVYCNAVMVGHSPTEFGIDFITSFIPNAVVSSRVFLSAPRVPALLESLSNMMTQYHRNRAAAAQQPPQPPKDQPPEPPPLFPNGPQIV